MDNNLNSQINIFKSVFKGREDVFAVRWENGNKSGYMPAYSYDPYMYKLHKMQGGSFQGYTDKTLSPLTDTEIIKHLNGKQQIGIYPLLKDNTSWFLVADFDKEKWIEECKLFIESCNQKGIPAYLERSRSGKGGHVWIFFEQPYPAIRSRKIFISILEQSGIFSVFDKGSSFDRLFPNQDYLSGKGFGNLIALPLYKPTYEQGNSCFIDNNTLEPIQNQWQFLNSIKKVPQASLNKLYEEITGRPTIVPAKQNINHFKDNKLTIQLSNTIQINRSGLNNALTNYLKEELNFLNTEYFVKKKMNKNPYGTERYFKLIEETESCISVPRGMAGDLINFCKKNNIDFTFKDERKKLSPLKFSCDINLREHQKDALNQTSKKDFGVIVSPPGSGKTVIGLKIIAEKQQPALIIVHRKQIAEQWIERIQAFLGINKNEIGKIGQGKTKIGKLVTVAMIQTLAKVLDKQDDNKIKKAFGTIIIDECHHIPAKSYRDSILKLHTYYLYGLTATPFRKYNDGKLIFINIGKIISEIKAQEIKNSKEPKIVIRNTELDVPFNSKTDQFETLSNIFIHDSNRNRLILKDIINELNAGKKAVIITERKEHINSLNQFLKQSYETVTLCGDDSEGSRKLKWKTLKDGNYQALITTGQFFGEGSDLQNAECLFLVYPFSFKGKLIQYIGRIQRAEVNPTVYDYRDYKIDYLNKLFLKRNTYYRKIERQLYLFDEVNNDKNKVNNTIEINEQLRLDFSKLDFRYGAIAFNYIIKKTGEILEFEVEHDFIRPEFEILKPYFSKQLNLKTILIIIHAEFENNILVSQIAQSEDLQRINKKIIDSVKFRFATKNFIRKSDIKVTDKNLHDLEELQDNNAVY
ncbi:DEAD/DEAH box helicase family protein, partial [Bacteroidota bacterium]